MDITDENYANCNFDGNEECYWLDKHAIRTPDETERHEIMECIYENLLLSGNYSNSMLENLRKAWYLDEEEEENGILY